uniref:Uncharacterized protein n=1 Tax=Photinus pyralis TaxID=7054 RepID=A0A1Y1L6J4_PHOPY
MMILKQRKVNVIRPENVTIYLVLQKSTSLWEKAIELRQSQKCFKILQPTLVKTVKSVSSTPKYQSHWKLGKYKYCTLLLFEANFCRSSANCNKQAKNKEDEQILGTQSETVPKIFETVELENSKEF